MITRRIEVAQKAVEGQNSSPANLLEYDDVMTSSALRSTGAAASARSLDRRLIVEDYVSGILGDIWSGIAAKEH